MTEPSPATLQYIRRFSEIGYDDVPIVGGKNASLGEMYRELGRLGVRVPNGFAITADAFRYYIRANGLNDEIRRQLDGLDPSDTRRLSDVGGIIRAGIVHGQMPQDLKDEIIAAYRELGEEFGHNPDVAVRSSATAEDLPTASFAGQQETYLNIRGTRNLSTTCKWVFASLFTDRAIAYRAHHGFDHLEVALSITVQKMVRSDLASAGVMFTLDTESGFRDVVFITSAYGLGENVVQGTVNPDEFYVHKPKLEQGFAPILQRHIGTKEVKMIYSSENVHGSSTRNVAVKPADREEFSIDEDDVLTLANYAVLIERHYSERNGKPTPMDIEWAKDGENGKLFIVQARPETVQSQIDDVSYQETFRLDESGEMLVQGKSVGRRIAAGRTRVILEAAQMHDLEDGQVLVTDMTDPDWEPVLKRAAAVVTNRGGRTCHAAIIARELGIPAIVGCGDATAALDDDQEVTVSCAEGDLGYVYRGILSFHSDRLDARDLAATRTRLMLNLGNPEQAFEASFLPADGVGLARLEFIINNSIGIHPRALLEYDAVDAAVQKQIDARAAGYEDPRRFYIDRIAEGVGTIAAAFHPRPVIVRLSDFKSNEYASMIGGTTFEPEEENPMLGFRGASRYFSSDFSEAFALECRALRKVRETMGFDNVTLMVPFVRTPEEGRRVLDLLAANGLERGVGGLQVYLMCEIPTNALRASEFLEHFDGFSIGSNDLAQLTLGLDRDSGALADADERDPAVLHLMRLAIEACNAAGKYVGICGQAPSDFPEITRFLVEHGIGSISLNPDSLLPMKKLVGEVEAEFEQRPAAG
ncbi:MAG: phosphoenolpyruvate synthase [Halofilum sp. (in: g-proteobacteria)]|nr:phosphoenolpyruvate synthase [Halofilum sp. (in: g-proteobacteria)]